jgi:hypothetical protein
MKLALLDRVVASFRPAVAHIALSTLFQRDDQMQPEAGDLKSDAKDDNKLRTIERLSLTQHKLHSTKQ